jgi:hypothetical protein
MPYSSGGRRGGRGRARTFNPSFRPNDSEVALTRQSLRTYGKDKFRGSSRVAGTGGSTAKSENEGSTADWFDFEEITLTVPNGSHVDFDIAADTVEIVAFGWYYFKRAVSAVNTIEHGIFSAGSDLTNADVGWTANLLLPADSLVGVAISCALAGGFVRLTFTDTTSTGNDTTVKLVYATQIM